LARTVAEAGGYYDDYWQRPEPPPLGDPLAPRRLELVRGLLQEVRARRVLDAGAGAGDLVGALGADGYDAVGLDVSEGAVALARERHPGRTFIRHSVEELPWPVEAESFDAVVGLEVIEHLLRPRRLLEGAHAALRPAGLLVLSTPYHGPAKNLMLAALRFDRHFAVEGDHIRFFSDVSLRRLAAETGFRVDRIRHLGRIWPLWADSLVALRR
jgi:2-polyprenyl-3-methyl-5-hydroxy-6-metoxy-1,4-benzoquinol methylase